MTGGMKKRREAPLSLRLTAEERAAVEAKAGSLPLGAYIKSVVLESDAPRYRARRKPPVAEQRLLAEILARLGASRTAANLDQIARQLALGTLRLDPDLEAELKQACAEVAWMRATLVAALELRRTQPGGEGDAP